MSDDPAIPSSPAYARQALVRASRVLGELDEAIAFNDCPDAAALLAEFLDCVAEVRRQTTLFLFSQEVQLK